MSGKRTQGLGSHTGRVVTIGLNTFTQLVRMKVFYFLGVFAVILLGSNLFDIQDLGRPDLEGTDVLRSIRSWSRAPTSRAPRCRAFASRRAARSPWASSSAAPCAAATRGSARWSIRSA